MEALGTLESFLDYVKSSDETKQGPLGATQFLGDRFLSLPLLLWTPQHPRLGPCQGLKSGRSWGDPQASARVREAPEAKWQELLQSSPRTLSQGLRCQRSPWPEEDGGLLPSSEGR